MMTTRVGAAHTTTMVRGLMQATVGAVEAGLGLAVNATVVNAPAAEAVRVMGTLGTGNLVAAADALLHSVPDVIQALAQSGGVGLLATAVVLEGGRRLISGAIEVHGARQAAVY